jgi:hypothetical protein
MALLPVRIAGASRVDLTPAARALQDSLRATFAAQGYALASDAELVELLSQSGGPELRRTALRTKLGAVISPMLVVRGDEVVAEATVLDVWRNQPLSDRVVTDLSKPEESAALVRAVGHLLDRVSWRKADDPHRVVVFDFDNMTGADSLGTLARQMQDAVRGYVSGPLGAAVIADSTVTAARDLTERRALGVRRGAGAIVTGMLLRVRQDSLSLRLGIRDLTDDRTLPTVETRLPLVGAVDALRQRLPQLLQGLATINWGPRGER